MIHDATTGSLSVQHDRREIPFATMECFILILVHLNSTSDEGLKWEP